MYPYIPIPPCPLELLPESCFPTSTVPSLPPGTAELTFLEVPVLLALTYKSSVPHFILIKMLLVAHAIENRSIVLRLALAR